MKKNQKYDEYKKKKADSMKKRRAAMRQKEDELPISQLNDVITKRRETVRNRVQKYRKRLKQQKLEQVNQNSKNSNIRKSYNCVQTLGKAVKKASIALPSSPNKKKEVLMKIAEDLHPADKNEVLNAINVTKKRNVTEHEELIDSIHEFYQRDDISRMSPKMRDVKEYKCPKTGENINIQTRHMILTGQEAFGMFIAERIADEKGSYTFVHSFHKISLCAPY